MRICTNYCKNCGAEYNFQASGSEEVLDTPREYQDWDYCPECKQAIVEALKPIEKKTHIIWVPTDEVSLDTLLQWEKDEWNNPDSCFKLRKMFPSIWDSTNNEHERMGEVKHPREDKVYTYSYWPSKPHEAKILIKVRMRCKDDSVVKYEL